MSDKFHSDTNNAADPELEDHLRVVFRREDVPASLTQRLVRLAREQRNVPHPAEGRGDGLRGYAPVLSLCATLITVCAFVIAGMVHRRRTEMRQAQEARAQLLYALHMTAGELDWAEHRLNQDMAAPNVAPSKSGGAREKLENL